MAKNKIQVSLPEYFTISHYKKMGSLEHLDEIDRVIQTITAMTEYTSEDVMTWKLDDMMKVFKGIENILGNVEEAFYPVFTFDGVQYGFQPLSKMSVGEYADLERRLKDPIANLEEIMAILYRRITKENFHDFPWKVKSYIRHLQGKPEQLFKLYDVEEYDSELRDLRADIFKELPIEYALGALRFFLHFNLLLSKDILTSSTQTEESKMNLMLVEMALNELQLENTTDISLSSETLTYLKSLQSPEIEE